MAVNCASIPESLIEAELFGYEDGAFTGARRKGAPGRLVQANGGTLFLDEIGDMPLPLQARLLRVLQERSVTPLGSTRSIPIDIMLIGATHRNLREMIDQHTFREDLYYRLNGLALKLPALRERSDLEAVARRILMAERPQDPPDLSSPVRALFRRYPWPGNIRQLANVLRTAAVMSAGEHEITTAHLSDDFLEEARQAGNTPTFAPAPVCVATEPAPRQHAGAGRERADPVHARIARRQHLGGVEAAGHQPQHHLPPAARAGRRDALTVHLPGAAAHAAHHPGPAICLRPNIAQPAQASSGLPCQNEQFVHRCAGVCLGYFAGSTFAVSCR